MADTQTKLPSIPDVSSIPDISTPLRTTLAAIILTLNVLLGRTKASPDDQLVTRRDLNANDTVKRYISSAVVSASSPSASSVVVLPHNSDGTLVDTTTPPSLQNVVVTSTPASVIASFSLPTYANQYTGLSNHAYTMLYMVDANADGSSPGFGSAIASGQSNGPVIYLPIGAGRKVYVWLRNISQAGVVGPLYGGASGTLAVTPASVDSILQAIQNAITKDQLATSLNSRIDLIDGPATTAGTVAARIKTETDQRTTADSALSTRIDTVSAQAGSALSAVAQVQSQAQATANTVSAAYTIKVQAQSNGTTAIAGIGLMADSGTGSEVAILADKFKIVGSGLATVPFTVYTTSVVENGVTIPAGVYIDAANIRNVNAMVARIGTAAIDQAKIGQLDVSKLNANTMTASFAQAVTAQFGTLSAIKAYTGNLQANQIDVVSDSQNGSGWGYIRSSGKFWNDGVTGWVLARQGSDGATFFEVKASSSRFWMSSWNDCGITFPKFSVDAAGNASFGGVLQNASGVLLSLDGASYINLNHSGSDWLLVAGNRGLIRANGSTNFNSIVYQQQVSFSAVQPYTGGETTTGDGTESGGTVTTLSSTNGTWVDIDTGLVYSASAAALVNFQATVTNAYSSGGDLSFGMPDYRVAFEATPVQVTYAHSWGGSDVRIKVRLFIYLVNASTFARVSDDDYNSWLAYGGGHGNSPVTVSGVNLTVLALN